MCASPGSSLGVVCGLVTATIVVALGGCASVRSSDLATSSMTATMTVSADGSGLTQATVALNLAGGADDFVTLSSADSLTATAGGSASQSLRGDVLYTASFAGEDAPDTAYVVAFDRSSGASAPASACTLPPPFEITPLAATASFSRSASDITLAYAPSGTSDAMSYSVKGDCVSEVSGAAVAGDPGVIVIPKGALVASAGGPGGPQSGACELTVTVVRQRKGTLDAHFGGGTIVGEQMRALMIGSLP